MSPSKAVQEKRRQRFRAWQDERFPDAALDEKRAWHDAHKAEMARWRERREQYESLPMEPLRVVLELAAPLVLYDHVYLEGMLAWVVVQELTDGQGVEMPPRYTPLPLEAAGFYGSGGQLPLWKASILHPIGAIVTDNVFMHKRAPGAYQSKAGSINTSAGRWMDRRIPLPVTEAVAWESFCYGNAAEIERLLALISHVGKRRGSGFGEIRRRWVVSWEGGDVLVRDGRLAHAIPQEHAHDYGICDPPVLVGWTPPHWAPGLWSMGWPVGTVAEVDWYADAP